MSARLCPVPDGQKLAYPLSGNQQSLEDQMSDEIKKLEQPEQKPASPELSEQDLKNVAGGTKAKGGTKEEYLVVKMTDVLISGVS
jgi:hypothetical protein